MSDQTMQKILLLIGAVMLNQGAAASATKGIGDVTSSTMVEATRATLARKGPVPSPALSPDEVVRIQLEALRDNDETDHGIEICFRFASPGNQSNTGPLDRFGRMIKVGPYRLMLEYHDAHYVELAIRENRARQIVILKGTRETITYAFYLSRQTHQSCNGCWMTDAVTIERVQKTLSAALTPSDRN